MCMFQLFETLSHLAAVIGIGCAVYQLWLSRQQAITTFEDSMAKEYRELAQKMPTKVFYDWPHCEGLTAEERRDAIDDFYRYFDLTNGQIFLRETGRVSQQTWEFWRDGIKTNMTRPAFVEAWGSIKSKAKLDFVELRLLIETDFELDPSSPNWRHKVEIERQKNELMLQSIRKEHAKDLMNKPTPGESHATPSVS